MPQLGFKVRAENSCSLVTVSSCPKALCFFLHKGLGKHAMTGGVTAPKQLPRAPWSSWAAMFSWGDPLPWALLCPQAWGQQAANTEGAVSFGWRLARPHCSAHCQGRERGGPRAARREPSCTGLWPAGPLDSTLNPDSR